MVALPECTSANAGKRCQFLSVHIRMLGTRAGEGQWNGMESVAVGEECQNGGIDQSCSVRMKWN